MLAYYGLVVIWVTVTGTILWGTVLTLYCLLRTPRPIPVEREKFPSVSILKALHGVDSDLRENLRSFFLLDYPGYEIIFSVHTADDPALPVAQELMVILTRVKRCIVNESYVFSSFFLRQRPRNIAGSEHLNP